MTDAASDNERPLIAHLLELRSRLLRGREALRKTLTKGGLFCEDDVG